MLLFGNLLIVPIEHSVLYVRPVYVQAVGDNNPPLLRKVVVEYKDGVRVADTLPQALQLFPDFADLKTGSGTAPPPSENPSTENPQPVLTAQQLLAKAIQEFADADTALRAGDFGTFGEKYKQGKTDLDEANRQLSTGGTAGSTTTTTTPSTSSTTTSTTLSGASA
jgi:uncharacterized membrane protein (UPF0182 family)